MSKLGYRPEIDGLRAFAVIPVILFHMGLSWMPGGYIGVDVFFVISGFLITSIIKKELDQGTFSFSDFWARRVRRILPAMIFVTASTLAVTYAFVFRPDQQAIGKQGFAALLSVTNIYFWLNTDSYWGTAAEESPFLHAWSLSVEEQFYMFFPIAMWLIFRFRAKWLQGCIMTVAIGSLALFLWGLQAYPSATFYLLPTRVWELGTGCLLAVSLSNQSSRNSSYGIFAVIGLGMIVLSYLLFDTLSAGLGLAVAGTALIIAFGQTGFCNKLLSHRSVVHVGKISYSLYLWHWPVLVLAKHLRLDWPGVIDKVFLVCATYLLALGTYHLIEIPTRRKSGLVPGILVSGVLVVSAALGMAWVPRYYDASDFNKSVWMHNYYDVSPKADLIGGGARTYGIEMPTPQHSPSQFRQGGIVTLRDSPSPELVLLGDSHAIMWADTINEVAEKHEISTAFYAMSGLDPFCSMPPQEEQRNRGGLSSDLLLEVDEKMLESLSTWKPKAVLISCCWNYVSEQQALPLIEWLSDHNIEVLLLEDPPHLDKFDSRSAMQVALAGGMEYTGGRQYWPIKDNSPNSLVRKLASRYSHVSVISVYEIYAGGPSALLLDDRECVYADDDHLTNYGAKLAISEIDNAIIIATGRK